MVKLILYNALAIFAVVSRHSFNNTCVELVVSFSFAVFFMYSA
jgi:hypothetical protein